MKIFILRHEKRFRDHTFFTGLTEEGIQDANCLKNMLLEYKFDEIYSSPYKRTLQTIEPYLYETKKKAKIEYSLNEALTYDNDNSNIKDIIKDDIYGKELIDINYKSYLSMNKLIYPESSDNLINRSSSFLEHIKEKYDNSNKNILLVSHMSTLNGLLGRDLMDHYRQGMLTKIYDDELMLPICFDPIN
tara:strand:+ start:508 stop:1074 length:567 start_codon:yes stop_codon:yes gene_type:complete